jgi:hypothetical protein
MVGGTALVFALDLPSACLWFGYAIRQHRPVRLCTKLALLVHPAANSPGPTIQPRANQKLIGPIPCPPCNTFPALRDVMQGVLQGKLQA